jgi:glycerophosphoryl diester phosphodiesterase
MAAFAAAVGLGFRYLETDVHSTADGVLVAFHDDGLARTTGRRGRFEDRTWAELTAARVGGEPLVRLEDLLATFPEARLNVDPKHDGAVGPLVALLGRPGVAGRVCVGAFSSSRVAAVRGALGGTACTAATPREVLRLRLAAWGVQPLRAALDACGADCVQVPVRAGGIPLADRRLIDAAHEAGLPVHVWTVDEPAELDRLLDLGVDGLMSDRPDVLRAVLESRGAWAGA